MSNFLGEAIESSLRVIANAPPDRRIVIFKLQATDAFEFAAVTGVDKVAIVDRLEELALEFGWSPEQRQELIAQAKLNAENASGIPDDAEDDPNAAMSDEDIVRPTNFSDDAIALMFVECNGENSRYVAKLGKWFNWTGAKWLMDETLASREKVLRICRAAGAQCDKNQARLARSITSAKTVGGVERLAQCSRRIAATIEQFDRDEFALNTPAGTADLQTAEMRPHDRLAYHTKTTAVAPDFAMSTPIWDAFLKRITDGDAELAEYLKRVAGYTLTGSTREHALFFCYGVGSNGKSTFVNMIAAAAGDYHQTAPIETFTASHHDRHPTELAALRGSRLVTAIETEEGRRWAESRIKALTGGDPISARFMRQDFFTFMPAFKLLIAGNHKPVLRSVDEAMRRRFNLIPFNAIISKEERAADPDFADRLKSELPGILAWMVSGCVDWLAKGLSPPKIVTDATSAYLESEDAVSAWLEDMAERADSETSTKVADLFASWSAWATKAGEHVGSAKRFSQALDKRGFARHRHRQMGRCFLGIRLSDRPSGL